MSEFDRVKERIRKLMAYANDGAATEGEIENAMAHAAKLIDKYHIDRAELNVDGSASHESIEMGQAFSLTNGPRLSTWEGVLAIAICELFGCVKSYATDEVAPKRINGIVIADGNGNAKLGKRIYFYGPLEESQE